MRRQNLSSSNEDDILTMPAVSRTPQRSSSRTYRWVEDQQHIGAVNNSASASTTAPAPPTTPSPACHPYLAYPQLSAASLVKGNKDTIRTIESYVFVDDDVAQPTERVPRGRDARVAEPASRTDTPPSTPRKSLRASQGIFHSGSPLRSLHLTFTSRRPSAPASTASRAHSPGASSTSTFRRGPIASHSRGSSLSTVNAIHQRSARTESPELSASPPKTTAWKFKRPSVAGHFSPALEEEVEGIPPPAAEYFFERDPLWFLDRVHAHVLRCPAQDALWLDPLALVHDHLQLVALAVVAAHRCIAHQRSARVRESARPRQGALRLLRARPRPGNPRLLASKRKLIISGIPPDDARRFDGVKKWCESFGELNSITRVHNGDLHVDFRKAEVADTVCRLNARVYIAGVGSVCLSWFTGKRP
ncbi:hypothetical protein ONZ51_g4271 [Trametes cubensis]|uniref:RRM domain-containing protein n=1 Tax=Trametes cubensis TaxID=1111947 RepID=A0AAD7TW67_9APHY|nr:hypothetical protein ONZ51_g4271 [Trametes cubensis]